MCETGFAVSLGEVSTKEVSWDCFSRVGDLKELTFWPLSALLNSSTSVCLSRDFCVFPIVGGVIKLASVSSYCSSVLNYWYAFVTILSDFCFRIGFISTSAAGLPSSPEPSCSGDCSDSFEYSFLVKTLFDGTSPIKEDCFLY